MRQKYHLAAFALYQPSHCVAVVSHHGQWMMLDNLSSAAILWNQCNDWHSTAVHISLFVCSTITKDADNDVKKTTEEDVEDTQEEAEVLDPEDKEVELEEDTQS